jgi:hypothetical protein
VEWPTACELLQMANNVPTKMKEFLLRSSTADSNYFGAFQVILSNGVASPVFNAANQNFQYMMTSDTDYSLVKRINGTKQGGSYLSCLILSKKDGTQITKIETTNSPIGTETLIADSEEIIGFYGYKDDNFYHQLGFIVWTPP